jgi:hypothetical protein
MRLVTQSWTLDALVSPYDLGLLAGWSDTFGGALPRCRRCDILLGTQPCPNPECQTPHGVGTGELCTWCRHAHPAAALVIANA